MPKISFSFEGLDELKDDISKCLSRYPDETVKEVYHQAGEFTKDVNEKMSFKKSTEGKRHPTKEWHRSRETATFGGYTVGVEIRNTAPHWHLLENGHVIKADPKMFAAYKGGRLDPSKGRRKAKSRSKNPNLRVLGKTRPRHWAQQTRDEWEDKWPEKVETFVDKMLKGHNL